jgi:hypothetical protein
MATVRKTPLALNRSRIANVAASGDGSTIASRTSRVRRIENPKR